MSGYWSSIIIAHMNLIMFIMTDMGEFLALVAFWIVCAAVIGAWRARQ